MRVISGRLGGRRLVAPAGPATRPTTDRVRESLFSILSSMDVIEGAHVVDLYAGTGALGIEALSRGAASATFVESARPALVALRENLQALDLEKLSTVVAARVDKLSKETRGAPPFDVIFADPPWVDLAAAVVAIETLLARGRASSGATLVVEHASRDAAPTIAGVTAVDTRVYGDTSIFIGVFDGAPSDAADDPPAPPTTAASPTPPVSDPSPG